MKVVAAVVVTTGLAGLVAFRMAMGPTPEPPPPAERPAWLDRDEPIEPHIPAILGILAPDAGEAPPAAEPPAAEPSPTPPVAPPTVKRVGTLEHGDLDESSGLVASRAHAGVFWTHNDSGGSPVLYAVSAEGKALGRVEVTGATSRDWEAIAGDASGRLYVGDIGNNRNQRQDLAVHVVPEPNPTDESVAVERTVRFRYPDQDAFPPAALNFDAESLFHDGETLYLLTKHRGDHHTSLYQFPAEAFGAVAQGVLEAEEVVLKKLARFDVGGAEAPFPGMTTAADLRGDGERLAVLTYHALFVFDRPDAPERWFSRPRLVLPLDGPIAAQCEALAWDGEDLIFTNEGRGVFRIESPGR